MRLMLKAMTQANGDIVITGDSRALLFRTLADMQRLLDTGEGDAAEVRRLLRATSDMLGAAPGTLPTSVELLGDAHQALLARNLLKG